MTQWLIVITIAVIPNEPRIQIEPVASEGACHEVGRIVKRAMLYTKVDYVCKKEPKHEI